MPLTVPCGRCQTVCSIPDSFVGRQFACPRCGSAIFVDGSGTGLQPISGNPLLQMLDEELGSGMPLPDETSLSGQELAMWRGRRSRTILKLSPKNAILVAIGGGVAFYVLILLVLPKLAIPLGWLVFIVGLGVLFAGMCWQTYIALCEDMTCAVLSILFFPFYIIYYATSRWDKARRSFTVFSGGAALCFASALGIFVAGQIVWQREHPEAWADGSRPKASAPPIAPTRVAASEPGKRAAGAKGGVSSASADTPGPPAAVAQLSNMAEGDLPPATDLITVAPPKYVDAGDGGARR